MDFEKRYEKELKVNKLDDEFISDLAEKMAKKRIEALSAVPSEEEPDNVAIVKHDNRKIYISRMAAAAAAVAVFVFGLSYVTRIGTTDAPVPDDLSVTDKYDAFLNAHAETSAVPVPGSITDPVLVTVPATVTSVQSDGVYVTSANTDITKISPAEIKVSSTEKVSDHDNSRPSSVLKQESAVTAVPHAENTVPETTVPASLFTTETHQVSSVTKQTSELPVTTTEITYASSEAPEVSETVTKQPEETSAPEIPNKPIAGDPVYISAESLSALPGDVFDVKIKIGSGINSMSGFTWYADFSREALKIIDVRVTASDEEDLDLTVKKDKELIVLCYDQSNINHEYDRDNFIILTVKINDDAVPGEYFVIPHEKYAPESRVNHVNEDKIIVKSDLIFNGFKITVADDTDE